MIRLDQNFQHHSQVVATELDPAEAVLLHLDNQRYYTLNETGWFIWKSLEQELNLKQIAEKVHQECNVQLGPSVDGLFGPRCSLRTLQGRA